MYFFYRIGIFLANALPLRTSYRFAVLFADCYYFFSRKDKLNVRANLSVVLGCRPEELGNRPRLVFRNFAKYLVDFFRSTRFSETQIAETFTITGTEHIEQALAQGKGVVLISAHLGNWEFAGAVIASLGYRVTAIALRHANVRINDFFNARRALNRLGVIQIGMQLRGCFDVLNKNGFLAVMADRDFSEKGLAIPFFGKTALLPKGPAVFSLRTGAAILPVFMIRRPDDSYHLIVEPPLYAERNGTKEQRTRDTIRRYSAVIEKKIRSFPEQWYVFDRFWN